MHQHCIDYGDIKPRVVEQPGHRRVVIARGLHHHTGLTVQTFEQLWPAYSVRCRCEVPQRGETTTSPKGRMTAIMLFPLEISMPTQFIHIPPIQRICNRNPSFLAADSIYWVTRTLRHPVAQPAQIERCNKRMADSLSNGHRSPRREWSASCSSYCSLGTRWKGNRTGCPASLSKFIVIGWNRYDEDPANQGLHPLLSPGDLHGARTYSIQRNSFPTRSARWSSAVRRLLRATCGK